MKNVFEINGVRVTVEAMAEKPDASKQLAEMQQRLDKYQEESRQWLKREEELQHQLRIAQGKCDSAVRMRDVAVEELKTAGASISKDQLLAQVMQFVEDDARYAVVIAMVNFKSAQVETIPSYTTLVLKHTDVVVKLSKENASLEVQRMERLTYSDVAVSDKTFMVVNPITRSAIKVFPEQPLDPQ